jgi:hypothetical protein
MCAKFHQNPCINLGGVGGQGSKLTEITTSKFKRVSKIFTSKIENSQAVFTIHYIYDLKGTSYKMMSQNV